MLKPGDTIGILGGGQLGRMLALAAAPLGLKVHVYAPERDSPAFDVASAHTIADYVDEAALAAFANVVDAVTFEFENVPAATAVFLAARKPLHPNPRTLALTQDRWAEKSFLAGLGVNTAPFARVDDLSTLQAAIERLGRPAILKTRRFGYDGKGQRLIGPSDEPAEAYEAIDCKPAILEGFVDFSFEISALVARGAVGRLETWPLCRNRHTDHILTETTAPAAGVSPDLAERAAATGRLIAEALDYRGVLAVEMFVLGAAAQARIIVNELAPRVHNSGHWTIEGAETSQFEQHIRAVAGWPLGDTRMRGKGVVMRNLIGADVADWAKIAGEPGAHLHHYGKGDARPGRKMGHVTRILSD